MPAAYIALILGNIVYGSSYVVSRIVLDHMGPATLSLLRLLIGSLVLVPLALAQRRDGVRLSRADRWNIFWMGLIGFAAAFAFGNWGLALSTATQSGLATHIGALLSTGMELDWLAEHPARLLKVTAAEVAEAAAQFLAPRRLVSVAVGDAGQITGPLSAVTEIE